MHHSESSLYITEIFQSIQGESSLTGLPTTFIRLSGCPLRCSWCDTAYSFTRGKKYSVQELLEETARFGWKHVCVTGGEPLAQPGVLRLISSLCDAHYCVSVETAGSLSVVPIDVRAAVILDIKCPGSQMSGKNLWSNLEHLRQQDEVKFVLLDRTDYDYAKNVCVEYGLLLRDKLPLFSPVHGVLPPEQLVRWILEDQLNVRLNLQIHKYIWSPGARGV